MVNLTINGHAVQVKESTTILEAAESVGIEIPRLCYWKGLNEIGACRICVVEIEGNDRLAAACNSLVEEGMVVRTNSPRVITARKVNLQLILSQHNTNCTSCARDGNCSLQKLANELNVHSQPFEVKPERDRIDSKSPLVREASKCIKCLRCVQVCEKIQTVSVWDVLGVGARVTVGTVDNVDVSATDCTYCGQCITHCPVGALSARDDTNRVIEMLADPELTVLVQVAPAVRVAWAEAFGLDLNFATPQRLASALRSVGFDYVFDTTFAADLTIMEEGAEFIQRFTNRDQYQWPMFTSCCPGWIRFVKSQYPEFVANLSTAKSPQQMFGAVAKSYFAEKQDLDPHKVRVVSIMPCIAKKSEIEIESMNAACGDPDVDVVLTTREATRLFKMMGVQPQTLNEEEFDNPLGRGTGAAVVFGATGGVMDVALRSVYYLVTKKNPDIDAFKDIRDSRPWKEAVFNIPGAGEVRAAAVSGLGNVRKLLDALRFGEVEYDFVEVMACSGGCAGGGGQPIHDGEDCAEFRASLLWKLDANMKVRFSHENEDVKTLYAEYLGKLLNGRAYSLLHTNHRSWKMPSEP